MRFPRLDSIRAADRAQLGVADIVVEIVDHQQVEVSVVVIVEPAGRHRPRLAISGNLPSHAGLVRRIGKRAVAVVAVEPVPVARVCLSSDGIAAPLVKKISSSPSLL